MATNKQYTRIVLPKSLDKGTSYRTSVWVADSIFSRTGIPIEHDNEFKNKEGIRAWIVFPYWRN